MQDIPLFKLAKSVNVLITPVYSGNKIVCPGTIYLAPLRQNEEDFLGLETTLPPALVTCDLETVIRVSPSADPSISLINGLLVALASNFEIESLVNFHLSL